MNQKVANKTAEEATVENVTETVSLAIVKMLPANSLVTKGFHDGAKVARKDIKTRQEKHEAQEDSSVFN